MIAPAAPGYKAPRHRRLLCRRRALPVPRR